MPSESVNQPGSGGQRACTAGNAIQYALARVFVFVVGLLPLGLSSALGGWMGRCIGPVSSVHRTARDNLTKAFPEKTPAEISKILGGMWDNLGRYVFEFPHLDQLRFEGPGARIEIVGVENADALRDDGKPGIFFSGHLGNWELASRSVSSRGIALHGIYRAPNNPLMEPLFTRQNRGKGELLAKGAKGAKRALQLLKAGEHLGILVDQKMNDGIAVPFFGRDAMTAPAIAQFAYRYNCPIVPVRVERLRGARFRVTHYPPLTLPDTGDRHADVQQTMTDINAMLEGWIRARPEQWFWVHRRWRD